MFQLPKIQYALKLRRRSMGFLWVKVSTLLDIIISLMPFLIELLLPKKHLIMNSLPIPRSTAFVLVLPLMIIHLDLRKKSCYGIRRLGSACTSKSSCNQLNLMNLLKFVMKFLLSSLLFSNLFQISRWLLFVIPFSWFAFSTYI